MTGTIEGCFPHRQGHYSLAHDRASRGKIPSMTTLAQQLAQAIEASGRSASEISRAIGQNRTLVRDILNGRVRSPRIDTLQKIADELGVSVTTLTGAEVAPAPRAQRTLRSEAVPAPVALPPRSELPRDVPVFGTAAGAAATDGAFQLAAGEAVDYVLRPPALAGARDVYAIYVTGSSMEPAHPEGELRFVHPHRVPAPGDTVIIQCQYKPEGPIEAYIKRLVRRNGERIVVEQFNPAGQVEFERRFVLQMHKVLTLSELFGL